jgi:DNA primase
MSNWINFKELRAKLDFEQVLLHYGVEVKKKGDQHHGFCPLPTHTGKGNSPSFSANLAKKIFQCFGCGAKGNILEFAALMEKLDPQDGTALREVALKLQDRFCPEHSGKPAEPAKPVSEKRLAAVQTDDPKEEKPVVINQPLDFELKGLKTEHPYLGSRGFTPETIEWFGLGFCSRGMLKSRVAIPLHDSDGRLIGYAGRVVDDTAINDENPRYRFPGKREKDGTVFEFRKTLFLYNGFRIKAPVDDLIVVEGFASVWWLTQHRFSSVVATMGSDCSEKQVDLILSLVKPNGRVWLMPDGDKAGERCVLTLLPQIAPHRLVRWVKLTADKQPTDLSAEELKTSFTF